MILKLQNKRFKIRAVKSLYTINNSLAILLKDKKTNETIAVITVNLPNSYDLEKEYAFVDINNCPWAERFILKYSLGEYTHINSPQGYPLYKFNLEKLYEN